MAEMSDSEKLDRSVLSREQQEELRHFKVQTRIANEKYLREHPEVDVLLSDFLRDVFLKRPSDILEFAAGHFTDPNLAMKTLSKLQANQSTT
ncbi:RIIa domain-containing protein 1 isoform X2 [Denticeps clupeoides]|uniref:RIIa domain-containing protein 1 isoform X2 n=1 Tax=Denticeps clupeoides TaxID=299321 RepID=UPI0010A37BA7|nr:RIIa domain-containing protein 1 isoform X2 [Denticeps clupeoides]XP_028849424.1 RIIa domain-containing protein 1 isoform X2 [Denticeps clupeoides]